MSQQAKKLRELISGPGTILNIGVYDAFSAKVAEQEGFETLSVMGGPVSWMVIGKTDYGYLTQTEMLDAARQIVQAVNVPVLVDSDDGFGDPIIVRRTVQLCEQVGVAGIFIEDLARPLRCSAQGGGSLDKPEVMVQKLRAAIEARSDPNFVIIARTDDYEGVDKVIFRVATYSKAGADMVWVVGLKSVEDMERVSKESTVPLVGLQVMGTKIPLVPFNKFKDMGYKMVIYSRNMCAVAAYAMRKAARQLKKELDDGTKPPSMAEELTVAEIEEVVGLAEDIELLTCPPKIGPLEMRDS